MRGSAFQQGQLDALCGIYSLVHFIKGRRSFQTSGAFKRGTDTEQQGKLALRFMLDAADRLQLLNADNITEGFFCFQLKDVFNLFCEYQELPFKAHTLAAYRRQSGCEANSEIARKVLSERGGMIVQSRSEHWVLLSGRPKPEGFEIADSADQKKLVLTPSDLDQLDNNLGVVLLRAERKY